MSSTKEKDKEIPFPSHSNSTSTSNSRTLSPNSNLNVEIELETRPSREIKVSELKELKELKEVFDIIAPFKALAKEEGFEKTISVSLLPIALKCMQIQPNEKLIDEVLIETHLESLNEMSLENFLEFGSVYSQKTKKTKNLKDFNFLKFMSQTMDFDKPKTSKSHEPESYPLRENEEFENEEEEGSIQDFQKRVKRNRYFLIMVIVILVLAIISCGIAVYVATLSIPVNSVEIIVQSASIKEVWMNNAAKTFNQQKNHLDSGEQIIVKIVSSGSHLEPHGEPTVWSPASSVWVEQELERWKNNGTILMKDIKTCTPLTSIPLGLCTWKSIAEKLGWPNAQIGWKTIEELSHSEHFQFGHAHPEFSNSGRLSVVSVIYAFGNLSSNQVITNETVWDPVIREAVRNISESVYHMGRLDTDLLDLMVARGSQYLDAVAGYESNVIRYNKEYEKRLEQPFVFIYPSEGSFWIDQPYCILESAPWIKTTKEIEGAKQFLNFLTSTEQKLEMIQLGIRPFNQSFSINTPNSPFKLESGVNPEVSLSSVPVLPFPSGAVMNSILQMWYLEKKPVSTMLLIDTSASVEPDVENRILNFAIEFINNMHSNDIVLVTKFATHIEFLPIWGRVSDVAEEIKESLANTRPSGKSALYDAIISSCKKMEDLQKMDLAEGVIRSYNMVLMTDGYDTKSTQYDRRTLFKELPNGKDASQVHIYSIAFGKTIDFNLLTQVSERTNGKAFLAGSTDTHSIYDLISMEI